MRTIAMIKITITVRMAHPTRAWSPFTLEHILFAQPTLLRARISVTAVDHTAHNSILSLDVVLYIEYSGTQNLYTAQRLNELLLLNNEDHNK